MPKTIDELAVWLVGKPMAECGRDERLRVKRHPLFIPIAYGSGGLAQGAAL
jgi:hypothetical protein